MVEIDEKQVASLAFNCFAEEDGDHPMAKEARNIYQAYRLMEPVKTSKLIQLAKENKYVVPVIAKEEIEEKLKEAKDELKEIIKIRDSKAICPDCNGGGFHLIYDGEPDWRASEIEACSECKGTGRKA